MTAGVDDFFLYSGSGITLIIFENSVAVLASEVFVVTIFGTSGVLCFGFGHVVARCRNGGLCHNNCVTDRAMLALGQTGFGTGRCYRLVNDFGMPVGLDRFLLYENRVTDRAMLACSLAVCGASGLYRCIGDNGVTTGGDDFFLYSGSGSTLIIFENSVAVLASEVFLVTSFGTSSFLCFGFGHVVARCGNVQRIHTYCGIAVFIGIVFATFSAVPVFYCTRLYTRGLCFFVVF